MTRRDGFHKIGSVGYPLTSTQVKVVDKETKKALPQGQVGEIYVKGPQVREFFHNIFYAISSKKETVKLRNKSLNFFLLGYERLL